MCTYFFYLNIFYIFFIKYLKNFITHTSREMYFPLRSSLSLSLFLSSASTKFSYRLKCALDD